MKNLAKKIALLFSVVAVLFSGCSNDVGGSMGSNLALINQLLSANKAQTSKTYESENKLLHITAISDDEVVTFRKEEDSRTLLPEALSAENLTFYIWGEDVVNGNIAGVTSDIYRPHKVEFASDTSNSGTVAVDFAISNYKLKLAAVFTDDSTTINAAIVDTDQNDSAVIATVMSKSILYALADVDLRYNESVKFYLSPLNLKGTGTVDLYLRTWQGNGYWNDPSYAYTISIEDVDGTLVADTKVTYSTKDTAGNYKWNNDTAGIDKTNYRYTKTLTSGTYNFVVDFHNADTPEAATKHWYYSDKIVVLPGQKTNKSSTSVNGYASTDGTGDVISDPATIKTWLVDIPNPIENLPEAPANLRVGYNNLMDDDSLYYLATFEWDDTSSNEEKFVLQLLDVTPDTATDTTLSGLSTDTESWLNEFNSYYVKADGTLSDTSTDNKRLDEVGTRTVPHGWHQLAYSVGSNKSEYFDNGVSNQTEYKLDMHYAGGGLHKNSTSVSFWLRLGHVYVARVASINAASGDYTVFDAMNSTDPVISANKWVYVTEKSLTQTEMVNVTTSYSVATGNAATVYSPIKWSDTTVEGDEPLAINRYQVKYNLFDGHFDAVSRYGVPVSGAGAGDKTDKIPHINSTRDAIRVFGNITKNGSVILDPTIYSYTTDSYASLYKEGLIWTSWRKDSVNGDKFAYLDWKKNTGKVLTVDGDGLPVDDSSERVYDSTEFTYSDSTNDKDYFVGSENGKINVQGVVGFEPKDTTAAKISDYKAYSSDKVVYTNKNVAVYVRTNPAVDPAPAIVVTTDTYKSYDNLSLFAYYSAENARVSYYDPNNFEPQRHNVRMFKTEAAESSFVGALKTSGADASVPADCNSTTLYTDGELHDGTVIVDSKKYKTLTFILVEDKKKDTGFDKWTKATLEIKKNGTTVYNKEMTIGEFTPGTTTKGSGAENKDPLVLIEEGTRKDFYFKVATTSMSTGIYTVTFKAYTPSQPNTPLTKQITYKLIEE